MSVDESQLRHQAITTTARYWLQPAKEPGADGSAPLLVGCHGYAETARDHLAQLQLIPGIERWHVVAVEAPHPFYKGRTGEVVRSWMTKEDRDFAIADNIGFLQRLIAAVRIELKTSGKLVFSGFSQGAAMAWRAALRSGWPCHGLILLGGDLPPDAVDPAPIGWPQILLGHGKDDPWYTADKVAADRQRLAELGAPLQVLELAAGHEWHEDFHRACGDFLASLAPQAAATKA
jgi:predicted esterase